MQDWIVHADASDFWFFAGLGLVIGGAAFVHGLRNFWMLRIVVDTPTAKIRSAAQGYVELFGFARVRHQPLIAPLTKTPCVWYRYQVQEERGSRRGKSWRVVETGQSEHPFVIDDGTGECLVDAEGAMLDLRHRRVWQERGPADRFGSRQNPGSPLWSLLSFERTYRLTEERIHADDPVYLLGRFETPRRGAAERRRLASQLLRQWKQNPERMRQFDRNGDGQIDLQDWEAVRARAWQLAGEAEGHLSTQAPLPRLGKTGVLGQPFVISTLGEEALAARLRWRTGLALVATLGLGVTAASAIAMRLGA